MAGAVFVLNGFIFLVKGIVVGVHAAHIVTGIFILRAHKGSLLDEEGHAADSSQGSVQGIVK